MTRIVRSLFVTPVAGLIEAMTPESMRRGGNPIVPPRSVAGRSMVIVIAIMSFLACLTTGSVYLINQSANAWFQDIASEVTVQVRPMDGMDMENRLTKITNFLAKERGLASVRPLSKTESGDLLEPWLGEGASALGSLPVPRLIAVEINRDAPAKLTDIKKRLESRFKGVFLDDHGHWQTQIRTVTNSLALGGIAVLLLVAAATIAIIISAARSSMSSNKTIVEVLNFVGANHHFIVHEFDRHFLVLGIRAGFLGALSASIVFLVMPTVMRFLGGASVTATELKRLIGPAALDLPGYLIILSVVFVVAGICMVTAHYWVDHILNFEARKARKANSGVASGVFGKLTADPGMRNSAEPQTPARSPNQEEVLIDMGRWIRAGFKGAIAVALLIVCGFFVFALSIDHQPPKSSPRADAIVVLTGGGKRIEAALSLLSRGQAGRLFITGVHPATSDAILSRLIPINEKVFSCCVDVDREALNTIGNAKETQKWSSKHNYKSLIIVTSGYHMPRSLIELKRALPGIVLTPYPVISKRFSGTKWWLKAENIQLVTTEYIKFIPAVVRLGGSRIYTLAKHLKNGK